MQNISHFTIIQVFILVLQHPKHGPLVYEPVHQNMDQVHGPLIFTTPKNTVVNNNKMI